MKKKIQNRNQGLITLLNYYFKIIFKRKYILEVLCLIHADFVECCEMFKFLIWCVLYELMKSNYMMLGKYKLEKLQIGQTIYVAHYKAFLMMLI